MTRVKGSSRANPAPKKSAKRAKRNPTCPECASSEIIPVLHGIITPALQRSIDAGEAIAAQREEWEGMTEWYCKTCGCDWGRHSRRFKKTGGVNATRG
ncbi:MAG: hypothetical protein ACREP3_03440 [Candidatus Binatia bacterium]